MLRYLQVELCLAQGSWVETPITLTASKPFLEHDRKHVLRLLQLHGDQALDSQGRTAAEEDIKYICDIRFYGLLANLANLANYAAFLRLL